MREAAASGPAMPRRFELIVLLGALSTFGPLSIDMYLPAFPDLEAQFATSASMVQATLSACLLGLAFGQVLAGPLSDAFGRRRPLVVGVAGYALFSFLCALAPSVEALIAFRLLQGLCGAAGIVIARAIVRDMYSGAEMARFFSVLMLVSGLAPILAPIAGGQVLRVVAWPGVFVVLGAIGVLFATAAALRLPETHALDRRQPANPRATLAVFGSLLRDRAFMGFALTLGLSAAGMFAYISGSTFVLQEIYGASPQRFSLYFGLNAIGIMLMG
jgi:DHA1 family bicyclomycin/chloramphenicol resistance-like MFS transporter